MFSYQQFVKDRNVMDEQHNEEARLQHALKVAAREALKKDKAKIEEQCNILCDKFQEVLALAKAHTLAYTIDAPAEFDEKGNIIKHAVKQDEPYLKYNLDMMYKYASTAYADLYKAKARSFSHSDLQICQSFYRAQEVQDKLVATKNDVISHFPTAEETARAKVILLLNSILASAEKVRAELLPLIEEAVKLSVDTKQAYRKS